MEGYIIVAVVVVAWVLHQRFNDALAALRLRLEQREAEHVKLAATVDRLRQELLVLRAAPAVAPVPLARPPVVPETAAARTTAPAPVVPTPAVVIPPVPAVVPQPPSPRALVRPLPAAPLLPEPAPVPVPAFLASPASAPGPMPAPAPVEAPKPPAAKPPVPPVFRPQPVPAEPAGPLGGNAPNSSCSITGRAFWVPWCSLRAWVSWASTRPCGFRRRCGLP